MAQSLNQIVAAIPDRTPDFTNSVSGNTFDPGCLVFAYFLDELSFSVPHCAAYGTGAEEQLQLVSGCLF